MVHKFVDRRENPTSPADIVICTETWEADRKKVMVRVGLDDFDSLNKLCLDKEDMSLAELAADNPRRAYILCKRAVLRMGSQRVAGITVNKDPIVDRATCTPQELALMGITALDRFPDEDVSEVDFSIGVHPTKEIADSLSIPLSHNLIEVSLRVSPPNLVS